MAGTNFMIYLQTNAANHLVEIILENQCNITTPILYILKVSKFIRTNNLDKFSITHTI